MPKVLNLFKKSTAAHIGRRCFLRLFRPQRACKANIKAVYLKSKQYTYTAQILFDLQENPDHG